MNSTTEKPIIASPEAYAQSAIEHSSTNKYQNFEVGLIEGFFGTPWPEEIRLRYPAWLKKEHYDFYIYAPKNDANLRSKWRQPYTSEYLAFLTRFSDTCKQTGIKPGIGFTPLGATTEITKDLQLFRSQLLAILDATKPSILAILFDDLKIDSETIGAAQNILLKEAANLCAKYGASLMTCPTFYTPDPILEKVFGAKPKHYYHDFFLDLDSIKNFGVFWTGPKVISKDYPEEHLKETIELLGRKPYIWDNYPVNDGRKASGLLNLAPFSHTREFLPKYTLGVAVNPMKEPLLSMLPLATIHQSLSHEAKNPLQDIQGHNPLQAKEFLGFNAEFISFIKEDATSFLKHPLETWDDSTKELLLSKLATVASCEAKMELIDFINGKYVFDPACLTG